MNFNLDLDDHTTQGLGQMAKELDETPSGLSRKALRECLDKQTLANHGWPSLVLEWRAASDMPPFESYRGEFLPPPEDAIS